MASDDKRTAVHYQTGLFGPEGQKGVILQERTGAIITQLSFFKNQKVALSKWLAASCSAAMPAPGQVEKAEKAVIARAEPQKIWHISSALPSLDGADAFYPLDMSGARRILDITGADARAVMARLSSADFRDVSFGMGQFMSTGMHHVGVQVMRLNDGFRLFVPRSFSESLFDLTAEISAQFGLEIKKEAAYQV